eukprot:16444076-Heterocapsa_arctica.AAC.1
MGTISTSSTGSSAPTAGSTVRPLALGSLVTHRPQGVPLREQAVPQPPQEVQVVNKVFRAPGRPRDHQGSR